MSIGTIMYSKMPTKPKLSHFFGFGLPSISQSHIIAKYDTGSQQTESRKYRDRDDEPYEGSTSPSYRISNRISNKHKLTRRGMMFFYKMRKNIQSLFSLLFRSQLTIMIYFQPFGFKAIRPSSHEQFFFDKVGLSQKNMLA